MNLVAEIRYAIRSLARAKALSASVVLTLMLGIGANAAVSVVVREVLLKPLPNRAADRLIYIRQSAIGTGVKNARFSVPELRDLQARVKSISAFGDFSTIEFTMLGLGEPRTVRAGVVGGSYFDVMGLRPLIGRLLDAHDDGPDANGAAVLTYNFWRNALNANANVVGTRIRLSDRPATIVGVLERSTPYPEETEIIANIVTSPHHLSATMIEGRVHRMTELFGRLAADADLASAKAELQAVHRAMTQEHPEAYPREADYRLSAIPFRDQIVSPIRSALLVLFTAAALIFTVSCGNVANLVLARWVRREGELAVRATLGAGHLELRRMLLVESLLLCGAGALLAIVIARPMVAVLGMYAARYSIRARDITADWTSIAVSVILAMAVAVLLAFVHKLPSAHSASRLSTSGSRITANTTRRLRVFAMIQVAASFVLLAGATSITTTLFALQRQHTIIRGTVLALDVPVGSYSPQAGDLATFYKEAVRRIAALPGVENVASGMLVPWRDPGLAAAQFTTEGHRKNNGEQDPRAQFRAVSPGFFAVLGIPLIAGRDFNDADRLRSEKVVIVSKSLAERVFPDMEALNRHIMWTDPITKFVGISTEPRRIVGIVPDVDDEHLVAMPIMTVFHPMDQEPFGGRLFVHARMDPYVLVPEITQTIRELAPQQPVERAETLQDVRAEALVPNQINALVFDGFAGVALAIAVIGVAGVLSASVSARTHEFGIRMAIGSTPAALMMRTMREGAVIVVAGIVAGALCGGALVWMASTYVVEIRAPGAAPIAASVAMLIVAAALASMVPAARAFELDVISTLRAD